MSSSPFLGQLNQRIRILAFVIAAVLVAGAFLAVTQRPARSTAAPHFLGMRQLQLDAANGKATIYLRMILTAGAVKPGAPGSQPTKFPLTSETWSVTNSTTPGSATGGAGSGKVTFNPFSITRKVDRASPLFFQYAAIGTKVKTATIVVLPPGGPPTVSIRYELGQVTVSSDAQSNSVGRSTETITLAYQSITENYLENGKVVSTFSANA